MAIPDWLNIQEISRLWGEETGQAPTAFQNDLEEWFAEFVKEPPTSRQLVPGVKFDTIIANRLLGMLGARHLERRTFEAYCEERGHSKPRFWFTDWEAERESTGSSLEQSQQELIKKAALASAEAAELKAQLEAAQRRSSVNYNDPQTNRQSLQQVTARQKRRGRVILVAGLAVPLVALLILGTVTMIQFAAKGAIPPSAETADTMAGPGPADGGLPPVQPETAALSLVPATGKLDLGGGVPLADEQDLTAAQGLILRQAVESARQTTPAETSARTREQLYAALASAIDAEKSTTRAQADTMRLRGGNTRPTDEFTRTKAIADEADAVRLTEELAARQQDVVATQAPTGLMATAPSDHLPVADQKDPDRTQNVEDVETAPEFEEILTAAKISSDPVTSETNAPRDMVSPDDLLLEPNHHVGHQVMVTGSVIWLLRRYWLQSDSGHLRMLIDVKGLQIDDRNKLKDAVVQIEFLAQARARITGTVERQGSENYHLAATQLVLFE
jgi:hypothetical protein